MVRLIPLVLRLPDHLKLTTAQEAQIRALLEQFAADTHADRDALVAILEEARAARQANKSAEEVRAILEQGKPIRQRMVTAEQKLRTDLLGVLTAGQKAWIESRQPRRCDSFGLTEAQRAEISGLFATFEQAYAADLATIRTALETARAAQRNGASRDEIRGILESAQPAMDRVRAAQIQLSVAVLGVLNPAQVASGCYTPHLRRA